MPLDRQDTSNTIFLHFYDWQDSLRDGFDATALEVLTYR
jgi:hypothetical protein